MQDKITIADAPACLNTNDKAMWVLGYQAALVARSTCLHRMQVPSAAEQAAWHAGLNEGRAQAVPAAVAWTMPAEPTEQMIEVLMAGEDRLRARNGDDLPKQRAKDRYRALLSLAATPAAAPVDKSPELQGSVVDKTVNLQDAAAAPVVPHEPDRIARNLMQFVGLDKDTARKCQEVVRCALLATATGLPAQAVAYIDSEVLTSFLSSSNYRPEDGWDCHIRHQENKRDTDVPLYAAPQAQADARDADGEAFRTAARLGLTLRFYGNCAQSGAPGTPSVYEVTTGPDSAEAMRASIDRAAIAAAKGE
ncbi:MULTISPECIES: hypothetical protein [Comamonas]|uniref:hypothetical protein n=1 Tax=Comamonas TaxID=283 RepID=UPI0006B94E69|nr:MULTISPECIES: hypothetical protein [Comamonas]